MADLDVNHLHPDLRDRWVAFRDGPWGRMHGVYLLSGYRSTALQRVLYYRYRMHLGPLAARPGTSNHERTLNGKPASRAVDIHPRVKVPSEYLAMETMARAYDLHRTIPSERWHFEVAYRIPFKGTPAMPTTAQVRRFLMALDDKQQNQLYLWMAATHQDVADIKAALLNQDPKDPGTVLRVKDDLHDLLLRIVRKLEA